MKKLSRSKLIKKLDKIFSIYIRKRYAINEIAQCFTCGKKDHYKRLQCGHFQSRRFYSTRWNELNCQVQCAACNVFKYGEQFIFSQNLNKKYGKKTAENLYVEAHKIVKYSTSDIQDLITNYEMLIKQQI